MKTNNRGYKMQILTSDVKILLNFIFCTFSQSQTHFLITGVMHGEQVTYWVSSLCSCTEIKYHDVNHYEIHFYVFKKRKPIVNI